MLKRVLVGLIAFLVVLVGVLVVRTLQMSYNPPDINPVERPDFDGAAAVNRLSRAIQFRTVSHQDTADLDQEAFSGFIEFMETAYPRIHEEMERMRIGPGGYTLLYKWEGRDTTRAPILLTGHYDTVPVEEGTRQGWTEPPYSGRQSQGFIWGRGALDDKSGTLSAFEAAEYLLGQEYRPRKTVYLAAHHDEETGGRRGAGEVAKHLLREEGELDFLVDEGMPVAEQVIEGIDSPLAMIGVAEKGSLTLRLEVTRDGGHASMPPQQTTIGDLASAIHELKANPMDGRFGGLLQRTFEPISSELPFVYRASLANLWLFRPLVESRLSRIPHTNAALRTTIAPTIFRAGMKENVLPAHAEAFVNFRIHPQDSVGAVIDHVNSTIDNPEVEIHRTDNVREASPVSDVESVSYRQLRRSILETFGDIPVAPSMFLAATDSRHYHDLTDEIYRFRPIRARPSDRGRIHGTNERIAVENYLEMIHFQIRLLRNTTS